MEKNHVRSKTKLKYCAREKADYQTGQPSRGDGK
jgi:hypothetical protein